MSRNGRLRQPGILLIAACLPAAGSRGLTPKNSPCVHADLPPLSFETAVCTNKFNVRP